MNEGERDRPVAELGLGPAIRDILAGLLLLGLGALTGGSSFAADADGVDRVFDALAVAWILFGIGRLARIRWLRVRATAKE